MFYLDTLRLIKKTFNRFFSLVMIVLIGTAFMMGLMSSPTTMRSSVDKYADQMNLQDVQLYSSYGFCDEDILALENTDGINLVEASRQLDIYCKKENGSQAVARILECNPNVNNYEVYEGKEPSEANECLIMKDMNTKSSYAIGDTIAFFNDDEDYEIDEYLDNKEYVITGYCKTPAYLSKVIGSSNLNNQDIDVVVFVPSENLIFKYYTTVFLTLDGSQEYISFSKEYENYISEHLNIVEEIANKQQDYLKEKILDDYKNELQDGQDELNKAQTEGQAKLDDAKKKLDEANIQIVAGQMDIDTYKTLLQTAKDSMIDSQQEYETRKTQAQQRESDFLKHFDSNNFDVVYAQINIDYQEYSNAQASMLTIDSNILMYEQSNSELLERNNELNRLIVSDPDNASEYQDEIDANNDLINENTIQLNYYNNLKNSIYYKNLQNTVSDLDDKYIELGFTDLNDAYVQANVIYSETIALQTSERTVKEIESYVKQIEDMLDEKQTELEKGKLEYEKGLKEYNDGVKTFNKEIEEAQIKIAKANQDIEDLPKAKWMILDRQSHYSSAMYEGSCQQMGAIGNAMPILFYLVAALVCMTTMTRLVDEQRGQIGIFRALGFSKIQVIGKYVSYATLACLIGGVIGIFVGQFIFPTVIYTAWRLMYDLPDMLILFPIKFIVVCILAFTLLMMIITSIVMYKSLNDNPAQLMRPKAPKNGKEVFLEKISFIWRRLSFTSKITARNLIRYKSRFFMTVIGVAGCTGLLVVGWGIKDSIADVIEIQFGHIFGYDYQIILENDDHIKENIEILEADYSNETIVPFMSYTSKAYLSDGDDTVNVHVMNSRDFNNVMGVRMSDRKTELKLTNDGILVSEKFAENNNINKGDYITIESSNGIKKQVYVNEICEMYFQHYIFMSDSYYEEIFEENVHNKNIAIKTQDIDELKDDIKQLQDYLTLVDFSSLIVQFETMIQALNLIILVIILAAGSLALVVLINLTQVNISERIREIATLKVLGFRNNEVDSYIFKEILLLTIIGALVGLPLGVIEHHFIMNVIDMEMVTFGMNISIYSFTYAFVITITFSIIVLLFTRKPLREVNMIESLKSVE